MPSHERHHFIPDAFLSVWERPPGPKLTYFTNRNGDVMGGRVTAKNAAKRLGLYTLHTVKPRDRNALEVDHFQRIDNAGAAVHRTLLTANNPTELTEAQRGAWIAFVISLGLRTPRHLRWETARTAQFLHQAAYGDGAREDFREAFEQQMGARGELAGDMTKAAAADLSGGCSWHPIFADATWGLRDLSSSKADLLIGDDPVIRCGRLKAGEVFAVVLPISPTQLFYATNSAAIVEWMEAILADELVFVANRDATTKATEYVYATGMHHLDFARRFLSQEVAQGNSYLAHALGFRAPTS